MALATPSYLALALRALTLRCPQCGTRGVLANWFRLEESCPTCGLRTDRVAGHWVGGVGVNTIVSFGVLAIVVVVGAIVTYPHVPMVPMMTAGIGTAVGMPILFWPFSQLVWTAVDLGMRPATLEELDPRYAP
ncbi:MAG: hypothetical protein FJW83_07140 [Actinobacteria bacterium]|nr:hypothetical protein [Actinomycetota bacterium]